jgi:hypothetical protein
VPSGQKFSNLVMLRQAFVWPVVVLVLSVVVGFAHGMANRTGVLDVNGAIAIHSGTQHFSASHFDLWRERRPLAATPLDPCRRAHSGVVRSQWSLC